MKVTPEESAGAGERGPNQSQATPKRAAVSTISRAARNGVASHPRLPATQGAAAAPDRMTKSSTIAAGAKNTAGRPRADHRPRPPAVDNPE